MRSGPRGWGGIVSAMVVALVAACAPAIGPGASPQTSPAAAAATDLAAQKKAAGIQDCPESDRTVEPLPNGLPDVVVSCLGGGRDVRLAGLRGTPMMINVWGQWCAPCRAEAPYITEIANRDHPDLLLIGIDYDDPEPDWAIEFARLSKWRFPQLADPDRKLAGPLKVSAGPPQTLFVDAEGVVVYRHAGPFVSAGQIRTAVRDHLGVDLR